MRIFKLFVIILASVTGLFLVFAFVQDKEVSLSRSTVINAPIDTVFNQVNTIKNRTKWSPWEKNDTTATFTYTNIATGKGAGYAWSGKEVGHGSVTYVESVSNQLIESDLYFSKDKTSAAQELWFFSQQADGVKVTWELHIDFGYNPFLRIMGRFMDSMVGPNFEEGLRNLKQQCE